MKYNLVSGAEFLTEQEIYGSFSKDKIARAIKAGKLSSTKNDDGHHEIDQSELLRWAETLPKPKDPAPSKTNSKTDTSSEIEANMLKEMCTMLKEQIETLRNDNENSRKMLQNQISTLEDRLELADKMVEEANEDRRAFMRLIEGPKDDQTKKGFWSFLKAS